MILFPCDAWEEAPVLSKTRLVSIQHGVVCPRTFERIVWFDVHPAPSLSPAHEGRTSPRLQNRGGPACRNAARCRILVSDCVRPQPPRRVKPGSAHMNQRRDIPASKPGNVRAGECDRWTGRRSFTRHPRIGVAHRAAHRFTHKQRVSLRGPHEVSVSETEASEASEAWSRGVRPAASDVVRAAGEEGGKGWTWYAPMLAVAVSRLGMSVDTGGWTDGRMDGLDRERAGGGEAPGAGVG